MTQLHTRLSGYLSYGSPRRAPLKTFMEHVRLSLPDSAIFGGMIRDFNLDEARKFKSDIDIVSVAPAKDIYRLIKPYSPIKNKFGGFRFRIHDRLFDIWSLEDTWAIKQGLIPGTQLADLCHTTFFTVDSAIFTLSNKQVVTSKNYKKHIQQRILSINLQQHPSYESMAARAIRMAVKNDFALDPNLCEFVVNHLPTYSTDSLYGQFLKGLTTHINSCPDQNFKYSPQLKLWE